MHMSDALVSPAVAVAAGAVSAALLATAVRRVGRSARREGEYDPLAERILPVMGVMGAFVFAAQMINFAIPATGSSGHIVGGILLAAILGPWTAFVVLSSVVTMQCLLFADGGLMALGCNILNMAAISCLAAYPLIYRPIVRAHASRGRIFAASLLSSVAALELGALAVTAETAASSVAALPMDRFLMFMLPIHLVIGAGEGLATAAVLCFIRRYDSSLLVDRPVGGGRRGLRSYALPLATIAAAALLMGASFRWAASSDPDGLEWSILRTTGGSAPLPAADAAAYEVSAEIQRSTAIMPEYDTSLAGIIGCGIILAAVFGITYICRIVRRRT